MPSLDRKAKQHRKIEQRKDTIKPPAYNLNVIPKDKWDGKVAGVRQKGERFAEKMQRQGKSLPLAIIGPKEVPVDAEFRAQGVEIQLNWKAAAKLKMVEDANNFLTKARQVDIFHPDLLDDLRSVLEENPLPKHSIGEFFILYGRFQQEYRLSTSKGTKNKMEELMKRGEVHRKDYEEDGQNKTGPLPYVVRNILAHLGTNNNILLVNELDRAKNLEKNKNELLPEELDRAKEMLSAWLRL